MRASGGFIFSHIWFGLLEVGKVIFLSLDTENDEREREVRREVGRPIDAVVSVGFQKVEVVGL